MTLKSSFQTDFYFEEIRVFGCDGLLAYGTAVLVEDGDDGFYVSSIIIDGGPRFDRRHGSGALGSEFTKRLFDLIAIEIENDSHAQDFFNEKYAEYHEPIDDDYKYQAWKDSQLDWQDAAE